MAVVKTYPDKVWNLLREVWESTPKITWQKLTEIVSKELGCDVPHFTNVRKRSISESWKKKPEQYVQKTNGELNKVIREGGGTLQGTAKISAKKPAKSQKISGGFSDEKREESNANKNTEVEAITKKNRNTYLPQKVDRSKLSAAIMIRKIRHQSFDLSEMLDEAVNESKAIKADYDELLQQEGELDINAADKLRGRMSFNSQFTRDLQQQTAIHGEIAKITAVFWGLEIEDLKDKSEQDAKRTAVANAATDKLAEAKRLMKEQQRKAFMRQLEYVEMSKDIEENGQ
jgi:hypothetical protein